MTEVVCSAISLGFGFRILPEYSGRTWWSSKLWKWSYTLSLLPLQSLVLVTIVMVSFIIEALKQMEYASSSIYHLFFPLFFVEKQAFTRPI